MTKVGLWFAAQWQRRYYAYTQWRSRLKTPVVLPAAAFSDIVTRLAYGQKYKADRRDSLTHPRMVQRRIDEGHALLGDCDDHAGYWIATLLKSKLADEAYFGDIQYENRGVKEGHAVAVFLADGQWYWADYGMPIPLGRREDWVKSVLAMYGDKLRGTILTRMSLNADDSISFGDSTFTTELAKP